MRRWLSLLGVMATLVSVSADAKLAVRESSLTATWEYADAVGGQFVIKCYIDSRLTWQAVNWFDIAEGQHSITVERPNMKGADGDCNVDLDIFKDAKGEGNPSDFEVVEQVQRVPLNP